MSYVNPQQQKIFKDIEALNKVLMLLTPNNTLLYNMIHLRLTSTCDLLFGW